MPLFGSVLKITWKPGAGQVVILDYLDELDALIDFGGQKITQASSAIRAAGTKVYDRKNKSTSIRFSKRVECERMEDALDLSLLEITNIPDGTADVLIEIEGVSRSYRIKNAVIGAWDGGIKEDGEILAIIGRTITGGELILNP